MYPHTITIINEYNDKGRITIYPTVLSGVHYQDTQGVRTGTTDHFTDTEGYVHIPHDVKGYLEVDEWNKLVDKSSNWTLNETDKVIKGSYPNITKEELSKLKKARTIKRFEDIDYGIMLDGHYGVYLK